MTHFRKPTQKLGSPRGKIQKDFSISFCIIAEHKLCDIKKLWFLHILFIKIIFTNDHSFYELKKEVNS